MQKQDLSLLKPDKKVGHYAFSLKAILGTGSYGTVYLGHHVNTNDTVAIKVIHKSKTNITSQEIQIMRKFRHPNIVQLLDVHHTLNHSYVVTEYCNGLDLKRLLEAGPLPEERALRYLRQIISALQEITQQSHIHRDLKPANIILHEDTCKLIDFGFSRHLDDNEVMQSLVGTPLYMAPQILTREPYTSKCDIWSLGLIYYEMLFGTTPWEASNIVELIYKIQHQELRFPKDVSVSPDSLSFLAGCLKKEESARFDWKDVASHFRQRLRINTKIIAEISQAGLKDYNSEAATHRPYVKVLPLLVRERSNSTNQNVKKRIFSQQTMKQDLSRESKQRLAEPAQTSSFSTECEETSNHAGVGGSNTQAQAPAKAKAPIQNKQSLTPNKQSLTPQNQTGTTNTTPTMQYPACMNQYFVAKKPGGGGQQSGEKSRRTRSQLEVAKNNQSDIIKRNLFQAPVLMQAGANTSNNSARNHLKNNITQIFQQAGTARQQQGGNEGSKQGQLGQLLMKMEELALQNGLKDFERFISNERFLNSKNRINYQDSLQLACRYLGQLKNEELIMKLEIYIRVLQSKMALEFKKT